MILGNKASADIELAKELLLELKSIIEEHPDDSVRPSYSIIVNTIKALDSDISRSSKIQVVCDTYRSLYCGRGGLTEYYVWDDDYEKRMELNAPLDRIYEGLKEIVGSYET